MNSSKSCAENVCVSEGGASTLISVFVLVHLKIQGVELSTDSLVVEQYKRYTARLSLPCLASLQNRTRCTVLVQLVRSSR